MNGKQLARLFFKERLAAKQQLVLCCLKCAGRDVMVRVMSCEEWPEILDLD